MSKTVREYLQDMQACLQSVADFTRDGRYAFETDEKTQFAVIRAYEIIGEIVKRIPEDLRAANPHINWRRLTGFRDFLAHRYDEVILEFVWAAVEDLPTLRAAVQAMLDTLPPDEHEGKIP